MCNLSKNFLIYESATASGCQATCSFHSTSFLVSFSCLRENLKSYYEISMQTKHFPPAMPHFAFPLLFLPVFWHKFNLIWFWPLDMASPRQFVKKLYSYCVFLCAGIFNDIFLIATFFFWIFKKYKIQYLLKSMSNAQFLKFLMAMQVMCHLLSKYICGQRFLA